MRRLLKPLWLLLALVFLFEAWLWSHLAPLVAWAVNLVSLPALRSRLAAARANASSTARVSIHPPRRRPSTEYRSADSAPGEGARGPVG